MTPGRIVVELTVEEDDMRVDVHIDPQDSITYFEGAAMLAIVTDIWHATNGLRDDPYDPAGIE